MTTAGIPVPGGFGLYIHWPFCISKCPYCDFNSHVADRVDEADWQRSLLAELDHYGNKTKGRRLDSVFFGGGTPSLMPPAIVAALLDKLTEYWEVPAALEVTLEANPSSIEAEIQRFPRRRGQPGVCRDSVLRRCGIAVSRPGAQFGGGIACHYDSGTIL